MIKKEAGKILKCKELSRNEAYVRVEKKVTLAITGATGTVWTSSRKYLNNTQAKHEITELQKRAILGSYFGKY